MKKIKEILKLRFATDISFRQISRAVDIPSSTVSDYCKIEAINRNGNKADIDIVNVSLDAPTATKCIRRSLSDTQPIYRRTLSRN